LVVWADVFASGPRELSQPVRGELLYIRTGTIPVLACFGWYFPGRSWVLHTRCSKRFYGQPGGVFEGHGIGSCLH